MRWAQKQIKNQAVTAAKIKKGTITGTQINLAKLGTVPSATNTATANTATANTAITASTANALAAMEPVRIVGASGQPPFLDGSSNAPSVGGLTFQTVGFYKDHDGVVHLRGIAELGKEEKPVKGIIFQLPPGFRSASGVLESFPGINETDIFVFGSNVVAEGKNVEGDVLSTGEEGTATALAGITFRAES